MSETSKKQTAGKLSVSVDISPLPTQSGLNEILNRMAKIITDIADSFERKPAIRVISPEDWLLLRCGWSKDEK